jgi:hypothetical protein
MFKAWFVIILFFLGGAAGLLGWLADFAPYYSFVTSSKSAVAVAAFKTQKPGDPTSYLGETRYQFPLRFKTDSGKDVISANYKNNYVPRRALDVLERDGQVTVLYLPDDPQRILFKGDVEKLPKGWSSLAFGVACLVIAVVLVGQRYRLARHTKYLGHDEVSVEQ